MSEQNPYGQQQPGQQPPMYGYPQQGFPQQGFGPPPLPKHPQAQTAMILGIIALAGGATCLLPIFVSPFAWYYGAKAKREMAAAPGQWSGQGDAQAGFVMGIIGSVLIALGLMVLIIGVILLVAFSGTVSTYSEGTA